MQIASLQICTVYISYLKFAARGGFDRSRDVENVVVVEVEARDRPAGFRVERLFLYCFGLACCAVEADHSVALRIVYMVCEDRRTRPARNGFPTKLGEAGAVKDIVAQDEGRRTIANETSPDDESLGQTVGLRLLGI